VQIGRTADPGQVSALGQLVGHRDRVGRLAPAVEVEDRVVDQLVRRSIEVVAAEDLDDVGDGVLGQHHAAQDTLLGGDILRRGPPQVLRGPTLRHWQIDDRHHTLFPQQFRTDLDPLAIRTAKRTPLTNAESC
jgi:hypothetical protein